MPEVSSREDAVVRWCAEPNVAAGTLDFEFSVIPPMDGLVDVQRRIPASCREAARERGVSARELDDPLTVAENVPIRHGRGAWRDFFCAPGVTYQYRVRAHHFRASAVDDEQLASQDRSPLAV